MKTANDGIIYARLWTDTFKVYVQQGATGILLAAFLLCCFVAVSKIELPVKEGKEAVSTYVPIGGIEKNLLNPGHPADILNEKWKEIKNPAEILELPEKETGLEERSDIEYINAVEPDRPAEQAEITVTAVEPDESLSEDAALDYSEVPSEKPGEITGSLLEYTGALQMDYCVGSTVDLSGISIYESRSGDRVQISLEDCELNGADTSAPGEKALTVAYNGNAIEIPYGVICYTVRFHGNGGTVFEQEAELYNYSLDEESITTPRKLGKKFAGWYRDEACTIPFTGALPGEAYLDLYAGFEEFDNFICDDSGNVIAYTGNVNELDGGLLRLPHHPDCTGVKAGTFANVSGGIYEILIMENITYLEPEAFEALEELFYLEVAPDNPNYMSKFGIVYTKDGSEVAVFPKGQENLG